MTTAGIGHNATSNVGGIAGELLKSFVSRIEKLEEEKRAITEDVREVYSELKGHGLDGKTVRQIIKIRRMDKDDLDEAETLLEIYKRALGMLPSLDESEAPNPP